MGIDQVHDDAEKELLKEVEVYQGVLALLHRTKAQVDEQIRCVVSLFIPLLYYYYYYYFYFFIPQTTKAKIEMSDGQRSGRSTGRVSCKSTELKRCSMIEMRWNKYEVSLASPV